MRHTLLALACATLAFAASPSSAQLFASRTGPEEDAGKVLQDAGTFAQAQEDWLQPFARALYRDGEWGAVLNFQRLGLAAMEKKRFALAARAFDAAIVRVEAIYADDANAAKARSVFNAEKVKDFKGEPYERAMLYYYRALVYLHDGDYQNARAAFLAADRHDSLSSAEDSAFAGNFGMMKYLAGWASACDGDSVRAGQLVGEARDIDPKIAAVSATLPRSILLIDAGPAPVKWGDGEYKHILKFKDGDGEDNGIQARNAAGKEVAQFALIGDVGYQARTRGGREIDGLLAGKARFKEGAGTVGNVALQSSAHLAMFGAASGDRNMGNAALAGMFVGLIAKGIEAASNPAADLRAWDSLPARVYLHADEGSGSSPVALKTAAGAMPVPLQVAHGACTTAWGRTRSALAIESGGTARFHDEKPVELLRGDRNRAFRAHVARELIASTAEGSTQ